MSRRNSRPVISTNSLIPCPMNNTERKKIRLSGLLARKKRGEKIVMLTAYDYTTAKLLDEAGVEMLLVGDSASMVVHGNPDTIPITMETMLDHVKAVCRGRTYAHVTADMPFMSYQVSNQQAIENAGRFIKEGGAEAVKLEGGLEMADCVRAIVRAGIPVMAHIGLSFQKIHAQSGAKVQGRKESDQLYLIESALALQEAGAFSMILELIQEDIATEITKRLDIPTIGIGAGPNCDGQVLVINDILGLYDRMQPKFVRRYANLAPIIVKAAQDFARDVKSGSYPNADETFSAEPAKDTKKKSAGDKPARVKSSA